MLPSPVLFLFKLRKNPTQGKLKKTKQTTGENLFNAQQN